MGNLKAPFLIATTPRGPLYPCYVPCVISCPNRGVHKCSYEIIYTQVFVLVTVSLRVTIRQSRDLENTTEWPVGARGVVAYNDPWLSISHQVSKDVRP